MSAKAIVKELGKFADIKINGSNPWDIQVYDNRFYRMFKYYFLSCAAAFRARNLQQWQIVLSKQGVPGGYSPQYSPFNFKGLLLFGLTNF